MIAAWLALPRPVAPNVLPLPAVNRRALSRSLAADAALADAGLRAPLPFEVRAVGELVRRYGSAEKAGNAAAAQRAKEELAGTLGFARARHGVEPLLRLRAVQTRLFLAAVQRWQAAGRSDRELDELAGDFPESCRRAGWVDERGRLLLSSAELAVQFRVRWTELVGRLEDARFRPSLDELRLYFRTLLERAPDGSTADERRLVMIRKLARIDSEYPASFALGVELARLGRRDAARAAFAAHLAQNPDGPWAARARNHALAMSSAAE